MSTIFERDYGWLLFYRTSAMDERRGDTQHRWTQARRGVGFMQGLSLGLSLIMRKVSSGAEVDERAANSPVLWHDYINEQSWRSARNTTQQKKASAWPVMGRSPYVWQYMAHIDDSAHEFRIGRFISDW
ncbi:unnamed protein product [Fusarium graminearum]|nr:unnamed protein product [Fusarium graminearum]